MILKSFQPILTIDFGDVIVGKSEIQFIYLKNVFQDDQKIELLKHPASGFSIAFSEAIIAANSCLTSEITWSPIELGNAYEKLTFKVGRIKLEAKLIGSAIAPKNLSKKVTDTDRIYRYVFY